jgi:hypothetical protein
MKTAVFNRDISYGGQGKDSVEQISRTYIGDRPEPIAAPTAEIELYPVPGTDLKDTDRKRAMAEIQKTLADMAGVTATIETLPDGTVRTRFSPQQADAAARIRKDSIDLVSTWENSDDPTLTSALQNAITYAAGTVTQDDTFYERALKFQSVANTAGASTTASTSSVQSPNPATSTSTQTQQPASPPQNPANHPIIQAQINNTSASTVSRRNVVAGALVSVYGMSVANAKAEAQRLIP